MNNLMPRVFRLCRFFAFLSVIAFVPANAHAVILEFSPSAVSIGNGTAFFMDVVLRDAVDVFAYQFSVGVNPSVLTITGVTEGPFLSGGGTTFFDAGSFNAAFGLQSFIADTLIGALPGVTGTGVVATIGLQAIAGGTSGLLFSDVLLLDSSLGVVEAASSAGFVNVGGAIQPVAEPSTLALLLLGVGAVVVRRRRM
jgi:hypothetical protein